MRPIRLLAFDMNCVGHIQQGLWRHGRDRSADYTSLAYWTGIGRTLERGLFDALFLADVLGVYDVHGASPDPAVAGAVQVPNGDPLMLVPAVAAVTEHLGFGVTANLSYEPPFTFARRMSTLDHLTGGRIGWNVVTGYLDSAARALGHDRQRAHDDRYDVADDYMEAVYKLWEGSWEEGAVLRDRAAGRYADPARVHPVHHHGHFHRMDAIHLCEPSPQRTPVLFQAGASPRGQAFAGRHAECVFLNGTSPARVRAQVDGLRAAAAGCGRTVLAFVGVTPVIAETAALAEAKLADYARWASPGAALVHASASLGVDLDRFGLDEPIGGDGNAIASNLAAFAGTTKRQLVARMTLGSRQPPIVGTPDTVADALLAWVEQADVDGFLLSRTVTPECWEDAAELLVPALQRRGAYKTAYAPGTLREKLSAGGRLLPPSHPAARHRRAAA